MRRFRATYIPTGEVVEYDADLPLVEHRAAGWEVAEVLATSSEPPADLPPPPPAPVRITKLAFRNRFSATEKAALEIAAIHNAALAANHPANLLAAALRASMADQRDAQYIDLSRADTRAGVQQLEAAALLAAGRAAVILDTPASDEEVWRG